MKNKEYIKFLARLRYSETRSDKLDTMVDDVTYKLSTKINNEGLESQLEFLSENLPDECLIEELDLQPDATTAMRFELEKRGFKYRDDNALVLTNINGVTAVIFVDDGDDIVAIADSNNNLSEEMSPDNAVQKLDAILKATK